MRSLLSSLYLLCITSAPLVFAGMAITDKQGQSATVEPVVVSAKEMVFTLNGQRRTMKLDQLTDASKQELIAYAKENKIYDPFPPLRVQVQVGTKQRRNDQSSYRKDMTVEPQVVIEGTQMMDSIPAAEATIVLIVMDTRAKYVDKKDKFIVRRVETIPIPGAESGKRREFDFKELVLSFDAWRDQTNVGGESYKYFIFGLRDPATKRIIDFQTNCPSLSTFVKNKPEERDRYLTMGQDMEFVPEFK